MAGEILVTGGAGRLARALKRSRGPRIRALTRTELDVTDARAVSETIERLRPLAVINTAATSSVEAAEADPDAASPVNAVAPGLLAQACARWGVPLVHISTDYVFGQGTDRTCREDDPVSPVNAYGRMKAEGERRVLAEGGAACVVRVAWLFGDGEDFISGLLRSGPDAIVKVAEDQVGSPTPIDPLAERLIELSERMAAGEQALPSLLHLSGTPPVARADWVAVAFEAVARAGGAPPTLVRVPMSAFQSAAERPRYSALDCTRSAMLFGEALEWRPPTSVAETFVRRERTSA
jgi:dTDP-4-dehydrorhamnose reductase